MKLRAHATRMEHAIPAQEFAGVMLDGWEQHAMNVHLDITELNAIIVYTHFLSID